MKKFWFLATTVVALLALAGCGGVEADIEDEGSEDTYTPPASEDTYTPPPPVEEDTTQLPPPPAGLVDNDGDGVISSKDCNDNNAAIHPWATETCNGKDDNCDNVIDEGCATPPSPSPTTDTDKDGYPDGPTDCSPNNANIHPGATELCNSIDDDCDGVIDEQCGVTPVPTPSTTATFTVSYPDAAPRTLNVQVYDDKSDLGKWWDKSASSTTTSVGLSLENVLDGICGFRVNVSEGNPATSWLCAGNGSTASLDPDAGITVVYKNVTYTKGSFMIWSALGGTASGCSALLKVSTAANCSP